MPLATKAQRGMCWEEAGPHRKEDLGLRREGDASGDPVSRSFRSALHQRQPRQPGWGQEAGQALPPAAPQAVVKRGSLSTRLPRSAFSHLPPQQVRSCEALELPLVKATQLPLPLATTPPPHMREMRSSQAESMPLPFTMFRFPRMKLEVWLQDWFCWACVPALAPSWGFAYKAWQGHGNRLSCQPSAPVYRLGILPPSCAWTPSACQRLILQPWEGPPLPLLLGDGDGQGEVLRTRPMP